MAIWQTPPLTKGWLHRDWGMWGQWQELTSDNNSIKGGTDFIHQLWLWSSHDFADLLAQRWHLPRHLDGFPLWDTHGAQEGNTYKVNLTILREEIEAVTKPGRDWGRRRIKWSSRFPTPCQHVKGHSLSKHYLFPWCYTENNMWRFVLRFPREHTRTTSEDLIIFHHTLILCLSPLTLLAEALYLIHKEMEETAIKAPTLIANAVCQLPSFSSLHSDH